MKFLNNIDATKSVAVDFTTAIEEHRKLYWDDNNRTLSLEMGNDVIQQIGEELYFYCKNNTTEIIPNGTVCMVTGALGESGRMTAAPMPGDGSYNANLAIGVATEDIGVGEDGLITYIGVINGLNTTGSSVGEVWSAGDRLYLHPTIPGALTNVEPTAPNVKIIVGRILYSDAINGAVVIRLTISEYFGEQNNVEFTNVIDKNIIRYNETTKCWENIAQTELELIASQVEIEDTGEYFISEQVETALQEVGADLKEIKRHLYNTMSTGVIESEGLFINALDNTTFDIGQVTGYIVENELDPDNPILHRIEFAGATGIPTPYLTSSKQTIVYIDKLGQIYLQPEYTESPETKRQYILIGKVIHTDNNIITAVENVPLVALAPGSQLRDLWKAIGLINENIYVYPNGTNLNLSLNGGGLHYSGINFVNDSYNPTRLEIPSQTLLSFGYRTRLGTVTPDVTAINPTVWDDNGVITTIGGGPAQATNQRVLLTRSGVIRIQYGQQVYSSLSTAIAAIPTEPFVTAPALVGNSILIGVISMERKTTALNSTSVRFTPASKFGELSASGAGGGGATNAIDVAVLDTADYYTSSNVEGILQEIGYTLNNTIAENTKSVVVEGTAIDVSSSYNSGTDTYTYTVSHEDTSTLTGSYGTEGIKSITVDEMGHITAVTTETYLTNSSQSKDFGSIIVTDTDSGYTWLDTGSVVADVNADTLTMVSGIGIEIDADSNADAVRISNAGVTSLAASNALTISSSTGNVTIGHDDTSSVANLSSDNANGTVIQDINFTFDDYGHTTGATVGIYNLDNRYYTETEINTTLLGYQTRSEKGIANGYASLDSGGKVPAEQLPSYVDDVVEYANFAALPVTGESGKIYITLDTGKVYRWSTTVYVEIVSGEVTSVNGKKGIVTLTATDVGAEPTIGTKGTAFNKNYGTTSTDVKMNGTQAVGTIDAIARIDHVHPTDTTRAPLNNAGLTGVPTAPTAAVGTNTTQLATTAFVNAEIANDAAPIGHVGATGNAHGIATLSTHGFMSSTDKTKIDSIESGAEVNNISDINALDLTDGGDTTLHYHSADRVVEVASGGNLIGSKPRINIIDSATVSATIVDNTLNNRVDITLNSIGGTAESVTYDNASSGMSAVNVQDAIDELDNLAHSHSNKAVLDELSDIENQLAYKGTVISGGGSGGIFTFRRQEFEATEGQTLFTITNGTYTTNSNRLSVYIWGIKQPNTAYTETSTTSFTMNSGLTAGTRVLAEWIEAINVEYFTSHATSHRFDGVDPITPIMIGAEPTIVKNTAFNKNYGTNVASLQPNDGASLGIIDEVARIDHVHPTDTTRADLISPAFTGNPTVAGPLTSGDSSNKVATTKFVGDSINDFAISKTGGTLTGILNTNSQIKSTVPTGTAPLTVTSTTKVANLNADLLDGNDSTYFTNSSSINYDNTISGLSSRTVKTAIDELASDINGIVLTANNVTYNPATSGLAAVDVQTAIDELANEKEDKANKGSANGYAALDATGRVPASQLPSYVDDVLEYAALANFPVTGETGKIYIALDTNLTYRWGGTSYVMISSALALGETSETAYRGDRGKIAYDYSQTAIQLSAVQPTNQTSYGIWYEII